MIYLLCVLGGLFLGAVLTALVAELYLDGIERGRELEQSKNRAQMLLDDILEEMNRLCAELERMEKVPRHEKCRCFSQARPISNADIIRAMTDEELADFITKQRFCTVNEIADKLGIDVSIAFLIGCKNTLYWLKQEAERSEEDEE